MLNSIYTNVHNILHILDIVFDRKSSDLVSWLPSPCSDHFVLLFQIEEVKLKDETEDVEVKNYKELKTMMKLAKMEGGCCYGVSVWGKQLANEEPRLEGWGGEPASFLLPAHTHDSRMYANMQNNKQNKDV